MPEDCTGESNLQRVLDDLGVSRLNAHKFQTLQKLLEPMDVIKAPLAEVLLALCTQVRIEDSEYALHILNLIPNFIKKIKDGPPPLPDLVPSSLALLNTLKKNKQNTNLTEPASLQKSQYCFDIITSYPDETLIDLCDNYSCEIFEVIRIYCDKSIPAEIKIKPIKLVAKLLRILPPDKRAIFTKNGIDVWFSAVIPMVVDQAGNSDTIQHSLEALEILTDEIVQFDYEDNPNWQEVVKHIHAPSSYRAVIHRLLDEDSAYWHRLWIIFMKLLKTQLTKYAPNTTKKPINILLHSAEIAFRSNVPNRCRAFLCWNAIIDSFANEDHDLLLDKRLKLLMVPFKTNNARHEETALAKLDSWWHLITRFEADMENVFEIVVKPFLTFCFGTDAPKGTFEIPVHVSDKTKAQCVRAFINMIGHIQCEGCVPLPKLRVKLLNTKLLVKHRKEIIHSLGAAIRMCVELNGEFTERHIKCVWKSFIITIGELPENNLRRDIFNETLMLLEGFTQGCDDRLMSVIVNVLIPTLLDSNNKIRPLLNSKQDQQTSVYKIIGVLNKLPLNRLQDWKTALESIKLFTNWVVVSSASNNQMKWFVKTLLSDGILVWTALAESVEHDYCLHTASPQLLVQMLLWPFQFITTFVKREESTTAWLNLYKAVPRLQKKLINYDIVETLMIHADNQSSCLFVLSATIAVLEYKLKQKETGFNKEIGLMLQLTSTLNEEQIQIVLPSLAGVIFYTLISSIY